MLLVAWGRKILKQLLKVLYDIFRFITMKRVGTKAVTETEGIELTHRKLWSCAQHQMRAAKEIELGRFYFHLCAMLMSFLTYEAYLNFIGERLAPEVWKDEQNYFTRKSGYPGIKGKLKKVTEVLSIQYPDKEKRPFRTVMILKELRDIVSHGKPYLHYDKVDHDIKEEQDIYFSSLIDSYVSNCQAKRALRDTERFIEYLHSKCSLNEKISRYGKKALSGISAFSSSVSTPIIDT